VTEGGLFIDIARECRAAYEADTEIFFLCGRDAAERIVHWDYERPGAIREQMGEYRLLVARRQGDYAPPPELREFIHSLTLEPGVAEISATEVRERIRAGKPWEHLVPETIIPLVRRICGPGD